MDGTSFRFRMIVAEECVFDRHEAPHAINLFDMHQKYADVVPVANAIEILQSWSQDQKVQAPPSRSSANQGSLGATRYHLVD